MQDLTEAVSAEELARYLDLKKLDERLYMFEAVSAFEGWVEKVMSETRKKNLYNVFLVKNKYMLEH